ncbi:ABC transporter permease [Oleiphilus messinensis]|uniref:ABC transporter permease n=2 Tax=Oleiphilus messinensis TaxID=141451 RepID=A0A1Y0IE34_9GAMM|nr:ABC transporter permease [Oleiphilus messinensis]
MPELDLESPQILRYRKRRAFKDKLAQASIGLGGVSVIVAITLIFFYLLYEVLPLFGGAEIHEVSTYDVAQVESGETLYLAMEEQAEIATRVTDQGKIVFFNTENGDVITTETLPAAPGATVTSLGNASSASRVLAAGLSDGTAIVFKHSYKVTYPNDERLITPFIEYPVGQEPLRLAPGIPLKSISVRNTESALFLAGVSQQDQIYGAYYQKDENFMTGEISLEEADLEMPNVSGHIENVLVDPTLSWMFVLSDQRKLSVYDIRDKDAPQLNGSVNLTSDKNSVTDIQFLLGGASLLVGDSAGQVSQWFMVRDNENKYRVEKVRDFQPVSAATLVIEPEERRKGFMVVDAAGKLSIYYSTANRMVLSESMASTPVSMMAIAPRANRILFEMENGKVSFWNVDNEHPEISWSALWQEIWYEGYEEPDYVWQSSAATNDFEPKYSLSPLAFGTLKAAFYAMLIATPLAICGALYTAYFMAPSLRRKVKPAIELMEALPTVILGFLAGLFFAPFMESNLPGVFVVLMLMPIAILIFGFVWVNLPQKIRHMIPEGWDPLLLIPLVLFIGWFSFEISPFVEQLLFAGDMRNWLTNEVGIDFDQRNALVVGAAMGFAVIPTIFSITEDAIFSVPKHLSYGSLALGATQWQTMVRVILPTASPGIFSALMIGMGRAVGETMIVLMATGNTPIMDINIFEGMRTLSANIAVEMPESEVGSSHFRILFLAAFVLFIFTFFVNTAAEFVRQRLRSKYSVI